MNQDINQVIDVSGYDIIDLGIIVNKLSAGTVTFVFQTNFQKSYDDNSWGKFSAGSAGGLAENSWTPLSLPTTGNLLFRYLRWSITTTAAATIEFAIHGMFRRRSF